MKIRKVLVVDDEKDFRAIIGRIIERAGYDVVTAADGAEALARFAAEKPDMVLLDGHLPDIDGFEVCRRLRASPAGRDVPIVMCTVRSAISNVKDGLGAGATGYLLKPFDPQELLAAVKAALDPESAR
ncbi:MAG: response regulator [Elusimicrobia bacterium]|nr:response regulator [Elusimicrobiota bacterium]